MRPMQFPRRFPRLIALVVLLPLSGVLFLPLDSGIGWPIHRSSTTTWEPISRAPSWTTTPPWWFPVQWLYKTAPGKKRELAMVADVVSDSAGNDLHLPMKLSP
jgi:hypothetical protein